MNGTACSNGSIVKTIGYDGGTPGGYQNGAPGDGNITVKSDLGGYSYGTGRHAATSVDTSATGGCTLSRCSLDGMTSPKIFGACPPAALCADRRDADGNMACITTRTACDAYAGRSYAWTSFDPRLRGGMLAETVAAGANAATLDYTPEHERGSLTTAGVPMYYLNNP